MQGKIFIDPLLCIFMVKETFIRTDMEKPRTSKDFPQGTGCTSWFFIMSAGTTLKCAFKLSSTKNYKKNK